MKVLVVDAGDRGALTTNHLVRRGFEAVLFDGSDSAWNLLSAPAGLDTAGRPTDWDAVVAACDDPEHSGEDLCRRIRRAGTGLNDLPVFLLTAPDDDFTDLGATGSAATVNGVVNLLTDFRAGTRLRRSRSAAPPGSRALVLARDAALKTGGFSPLGARERLGDILVLRGSLTEEQLSTALALQSETGERLGDILVGQGWLSDREIAQAYSEQVDMPFVEIDQMPLWKPVMEGVNREHALRLLAIPLEPEADDPDAPVEIAVADPWNIAAIDFYQVQLKRRVNAVLAEGGALRTAIEKVYASQEEETGRESLERSLEESVYDLAANGDVSALLEMNDPDAELGADQAPVIRFVNGILVEAVRRRASDVHLEPYKRDFEVRYRIDGVLHTVHTMSRVSLPAVTARVKIMADLDIADKRIPQDGRIGLRIDGRSIQLRVSTLPNLHGERVVLRILDSGGADRTIADLGLSDINLGAFHRLIERPHGIVLVTGPTGSGKSTTLYGALNALRSGTVNIMTCEDPIEFEIDRISQSNVAPKAGLTFATQLRAILRQDPDIVLVGEVRDAETAEIAFRAAMTGHLVLSSLHCNEAAGAPTRLVDMGVEPYLVASGLTGVVAQRLVRRLCPFCRKMEEPDEDQRHTLQALNGGIPVGDVLIGQPEGCGRCSGVGTSGRLGIHELMTINEEISQLILRGSTTSVIRTAALRSGMVPMARDGLRKVVEGTALLEDVAKRALGDA